MNDELASRIPTYGITDYTYDALGDLTDVSIGSKKIHYIYDGQNRRGKEVNGVLVQGSLYDGQLEPVAELDGSGNIVEQFVYGTRPNVPDYIIKHGVEYCVIADQVGSPVLIVNASTGQVVEQISYDAWGNTDCCTGRLRLAMRNGRPSSRPFDFDDLIRVRLGL